MAERAADVAKMDEWRGKLRRLDEEQAAPAPATLSGGSGGGTSDDMEQRVSALEKSVEKILSVVDGLTKAVSIDLAKSIADARLEAEKRAGSIEAKLSGLDAKLSGLDAKIDTRASKNDLDFVKGQIDKLPNSIQLIGFAVAVFVAAGISRYFFH